MVQVISFAGSLAHSSKHRVTTVSLRHIVYQLHNQHSLANTSTAKQTFKE